MTKVSSMTSQNPGNSAKEIILERYEIQRQLGKKAGRRTLLTRDLQTEELVVIKLLLFDDDFQWDDLKLFEREAETLKSISHPAIPKYLAYFEIDTPNYKGFALVQNYIPAESLEAQMKAGRSFSEAEVKELTIALLGIIQYLHHRQPPIIHRDIKPSNILLTNRSGNSVGDVYLVDFGSVQTVIRSSSTMTIVGSYGYMPPEQFSGKASPASDLYGLGTTLIHLVTGQHPGDLPQKDLEIQFAQAAPHITPHFSSWLRKMTQPILSQRFTSSDEALAVLQKPINKVSLPIQQSNFQLEKPFNSKITVNKNADFIEIIIPPTTNVGNKLSVIFVWYFISNLLILITAAIVNIAFLSSLFPVINVLILFYILLISWFGRKRLYISKRQISLCHDLFGMRRYHPYSSQTKNIMRLEKSCIYYNMSPQPCLIIWAGLTKYEIHTSNNNMFSISTLELDWIAQELSEWLGLPITKN